MNEGGAELIFYSLAVAGLCEFLQVCYKKNMIFHDYYCWIKKKNLKRQRSVYSILGLCIYCQAFWVNLILYPIYFQKVSVMFLFSLGAMFFFLELLKLIIRKE